MMIRAFIAIELTAEFKEVLIQIGNELKARIPPRTVRWVKPAAMHLTLVFLGETAVAKLDAIERAMAAAAARTSPITLNATGMGCFPNTRRPRVVWVGIDEPSGHLEQLKKALDRELELEPEKRPFSPHLTLSRGHKRAGRGDIQQLGQVVESATLKDAGEMIAQQIHLIRSDLRPAGPIYTILASAPFLGNPS